MSVVAALSAAWCVYLLVRPVRARRPRWGGNWWKLWRERRGRPGVDPELPEGLELLAGCVEAGLPLRAAVDVVAEVMSDPLAAHLRHIRCRLDVGMSESQAWAGAEDHLGSVAVDVGRCAGSGAGLSTVLRTHAQRLREEQHAMAVVECRKLGVRSVVPMTVCYLPAFILVGVVPIVASAIWTLLS